MATPASPRRWNRFRVIFRRCRITVLAVILALVGAALYLDRVGLPDFVKQPLIAKLHDRGLDLQFSRLRWRPSRGIVAENVVFGRTNDVANPQLTLQEMQVRLNYGALWRRQVQVESLALRQGKFTWPVPSTNGPDRELSIDHIQTDLQLLTNDVWQLDNFQGEFGGAKLQLSGTLTNASAVRGWKLFHGAPAAPGTLQARLRRLSDTLEKIHFTTPPSLKLEVHGDALNLENSSVRLFIVAAGGETPWGTANGIRCYVVLSPPTSNEWSRAEVTFRAADATTRWAAITNLTATLRLFSTEQLTNVVHADLDLAAQSVAGNSNRLEDLHAAAHWFLSLTNPLPLSGVGELRGNRVVTKWGSARQLAATVRLSPWVAATNANPDWAWWSQLAPYPLDLDFRAEQVQLPNLDVQEISGSGKWRAPDLSLEKLAAKLYGGSAAAQAQLDVGTRALTFSMSSDFDGQKISPLLTPMAQEWLANYSWETPPQIKADGALVLPASVWTNRQPDWKGEVRPTLWLNGQFHVDRGAFRGVQALTADSHFSYSNLVWRLPDLVALRREGRLDLGLVSDERTKEFSAHLHSTIDPHAVAPLLATNQLRVFDFFTLTQPPVVDGDVRGHWHDHESLNARAQVTLTNFTVRGGAADSFRADLAYTNHVLSLFHPAVQMAATQQLRADLVKIVFDERRIYVTNGFSTAEPTLVVHAIGPHAEHAVAPYHFLTPPTVHVEGAVPMGDPHDADLHFDVDGGPMEWFRIRVPHVNGKLDWVGEHLVVRDVQTDFYGGKASGAATFDFLTNHSADYRFNVAVADANLHFLAQDLAQGLTNKLEGLLNVQVDVTHANTADWQQWQGAGRVDLRDGLIWDIPIFGVFSPALDTVMPGLGSSRARQGSATFTITNGVVDSEDLKVETLMARLRYWGTIDLQGNVDARMEAELFRNTWVVGPVLSLALWPVSKTFEYKISGTIHKPKSDPYYIPRIFFFPLHPVQTIKGMLPESTESSTNLNLYPDVPP